MEPESKGESVTRTPEEVISDYLEQHEGSVSVSVAALAKTWELDELTFEDKARIADQLADVGVLVEPPLEEAALDDEVTVFLAEPLEWEGEAEGPVEPTSAPTVVNDPQVAEPPPAEPARPEPRPAEPRPKPVERAPARKPVLADERDRREAERSDLAALEKRLEATRSEIEELLFGDNRAAWIEHHIDALRWPLERAARECVDTEGRDLDELLSSAARSQAQLSEAARETAAAGEGAGRLKELEQAVENLLGRERAARETLQREMTATDERIAAAQETLSRLRAAAGEARERRSQLAGRLEKLAKEAAAARDALEQHRNRVKEHREAVVGEMAQLGDAEAELVAASLGRDEQEQVRARLEEIGERLARARAELDGAAAGGAYRSTR